MNKRLYRKKSEGLIGGVCAGLAEYLSIDVTLVRVFFMLWFLLGNFGNVAYLVLWVLMPPEQTPNEKFQVEGLGVRLRMVGYDIRDVFRSPHPQLVTYVGAGLIAMGVKYILQQFGWQFFSWWNPNLVWPFFLIFAGLVVLAKTLWPKK